MEVAPATRTPSYVVSSGLLPQARRSSHSCDGWLALAETFEVCANGGDIKKTTLSKEGRMTWELIYLT